MKVVDFNESKAKKNGEITPKSLIENLLIAIEKGEVESVVYVVKRKDDIIDAGNSTMNSTEVLGLLEVGKQLVINDMYE